jgi:hypothetical protein
MLIFWPKISTNNSFLLTIVILSNSYADVTKMIYVFPMLITYSNINQSFWIKRTPRLTTETNHFMRHVYFMLIAGFLIKIQHNFSINLSTVTLALIGSVMSYNYKVSQHLTWTVWIIESLMFVIKNVVNVCLFWLGYRVIFVFILERMIKTLLGFLDWNIYSWQSFSFIFVFENKIYHVWVIDDLN